jgi:hypothetical protein
MSDSSPEPTAVCRAFESPMDCYRVEPCPACGRVGTKLVRHTLVSPLKVNAELKATHYWQRQREFFEKNKGWTFILTAITLLSPFLGLFLSGATGVVIGWSSESSASFWVLKPW